MITAISSSHHRAAAADDDDEKNQREDEESVRHCALCDQPIPFHAIRYCCHDCAVGEFCHCCVTYHQPTGKVLVPAAHPHYLCLCTTARTVTDAFKWHCAGRRLSGGCRAHQQQHRHDDDDDSPSVPYEHRFRCASCDFDLCAWCVVELSPNTIKTDLHPQHPLVPFSCDNGWICDASDQQEGCRRGITRFFQSSNVPRFRCPIDDFDLCDLDAEAHRIRENAPSRSFSCSDEYSDGIASNNNSQQTATTMTSEEARSNMELVDALIKAGSIRTEQVRDAFLLCDRGHFIPNADKFRFKYKINPYIGGPVECEDPCRIKLQSTAFYAECCEVLAANTPPGLTCLVIPSNTGYMACLLAVLFPRGISCCMDMRETSLEHAS